MAREAFAENESTRLDRFIRWWRTAKALPFLRNKKVVCDLGCGRDGTLLKSLGSSLEHGWGFDYGVNESASTSNITLKTVDVSGPLPLPDNSVDAASSLAVLEHVDDYETCIKEAWRILKPGGVFVATTPRPQGRRLLEWLGRNKLIDGREIDEHKRYFDKTMLVQAFEKAGFKNISYQPFEFGFNQVISGTK